MKASVLVGYTKTDLKNYHTRRRDALAGADIEARDGKGNIIKVHVREGDMGYRIELNGETIAKG